MTRARAHAIESKVNSLLFKLPMHSLETLVLPKTEILCILRYQGIDHEEAKEEGQVMVEEKLEDMQPKLQSPDVWRDPGPSGHQPRHPS